jgi:hypothetical protein
MTQAVYRRSLTAEVRIRFHAYPCEICSGQSGTGTGFFFLSALHFSPVSIIPPVLHTHLHLQVDLTRRTIGLRLGNLKKKVVLSERADHWIDKYFTFVWSIMS